MGRGRGPPARDRLCELLDLDGKSFVLGRDVRQLGRELSFAFATGARQAGATVIDAGLTSTDELWFASGHLDLPGVQFTASHNPAEYNGIKFCLSGARPIPPDFLGRLAARAEVVLPGDDLRGGYQEVDLLPDYAAKLRELVPPQPGRALKVVLDAGNGMAGLTCGQALAGRNLKLEGLFLELDGSFPNHPANPLDPANLVDAQQAVISTGADVGLVFDGDADRCFIIDERGDVVDPALVAAMIAVAELRTEPGGIVVVNSITSRVVPDAIADLGQVVVSRVGHTYVKAEMAKHDAIFGAEHSAHYYFRDFWYADTGMLAALHVIEQLRVAQVPLSELVQGFDTYSRSGEINSTVSAPADCLETVAQVYRGRGVADWDDGLTIRDLDGQWWFNLRSSNTEPLLRLNVEARDPELVAQLRDELLELVRSGGNTA